MVSTELPKSKTYPDPDKPHVAFAGLNDSHPIRPDSAPDTSEVNQDPASAEGPGDPSKRAAPSTIIFTEAGGVREGPAPQKITDVPIIVPSPTASHTDLPATSTSEKPREATNDVGESLPTSARMPDELNREKQVTGQQLNEKALPVHKAVADLEGDKPRQSTDSEARPEGTGTKRMFQLSKRFSE